MKIGIITEGTIDGADQVVCSHLTLMICREANVECQVACRPLGKLPDLKADCGTTAALLLEDGCDRVLIVWDLYPAWREKGGKPCWSRDRAEIIQSVTAAQVDAAKVSLVCIWEELEAWLLADGRALSACFSTKNRPVSIADHKNPERVSDPKGKLTQIIRENKCGQKYEGHIHAKKIAQHITDFTRLRRCETFRRFAKKVADTDL